MDLQSLAPAGRVRVVVKKHVFEVKLHWLRVGAQFIGLLSRGSDNAFLGFVTDRYSEVISKFIDAENLRWCFYGARKLERYLGCGYCRLVASRWLESDLLMDTTALADLKAKVQKVLGGSESAETEVSK